MQILLLKSDSGFKRIWVEYLVEKEMNISAEILVEHRSDPDREKCGSDRVFCLAPDQ